MKTGLLRFTLGFALVVLASSADAQGPAPASADACDPLCRSGFLCRQGQCISACNPPCAAGQSCSAAAECVADPEARPYAAAPLYSTQEPPIEPGREYSRYSEEHDGFMLRLTLGFGWGATTISADDEDVDDAEVQLDGGAGSFSVDLGGALMTNLVLHGRLATHTVVEPTISLNGDEVGDLDDGSATANLLGIGLTYYIMPANLYLTGVVGLSWLSLRVDDEESSSTDAGFGMNFDVGKEWWVSENWGLGLAGRFWLSYVKDNDAVDTENTFVGFAILFSATYQ